MPVSTITRSSPLDNLYPDTDPKPVFQQPGPVPPAQSSTGPVHFPVRDVIPPDQAEEGEVSDPEQEPDDQQDSDSGEKDRMISEDQNYRETERSQSVHGVDTHSGFGILTHLSYRQSLDWTSLSASGQGICLAPARGLAVQKT